MPPLTTQVKDLGATIDGIQTAIAGSGLLELDAELTKIQSSIASLTAQLENVSTNEELNTISSTLADIQADVKELLEADSVINQNITIDSDATLQYAETLIKTDDDDPNVIVNGSVTVTITSTNFDADEIARVNAVTSKLATVLKAVAISNESSPTIAVELPNLSFIDSDYTVSGADVNDGSLSSVTGSLTINHSGAADYSQVANVRGNVIVDGAVTSLNLNGASINGSLRSEGQNAGVLILPAATSVDVGTSLVTSATLTLAKSVHLGHASSISTNVLIEAPAATSINFNAKAVTGTLEITGLASATVLNAPNLETSGNATITAQTANLDKVSAFDGDVVISAKTVGLAALTSNASGTIVINTAETVDFSKLILTNVVTATDAKTVHVKSTTIANLGAPAATTIKLFEQAVSINISNSFPSLQTLTIVGKDVGDAQNQINLAPAITLTDNASLTSLTVEGEADSLTVTGTHASLASIETSGQITDLDIYNADALTTLTLGHDYIPYDTAITVEIHENAKLASVDLSNLTKVKTIALTNNASLSAVVGPSATVLAEPGAAISVVMAGNNFAGTYSAGATGTAATETEPVAPAVEPVIVQASIDSIIAWFDIAAANTNAGIATSTNIDISRLASGTTIYPSVNAAYAADAYATAKGYTGTLDTAAERAHVKSE